MRTIGALAGVGFLLLVVQFVFGGWLNTVLKDGAFFQVPLALGLICLWMAFATALAKGPETIRLAALCGVASLALFGLGILLLRVDTSLFLATSAGLFVLAITFGVVAYTNERTARRNAPPQH
jgi:hypothetical protein